MTNTATKMRNYRLKHNMLMSVVVVSLCFGCVAGDATTGIDKYFKNNPAEKNKFISYRLTSVRTERDHEKYVSWILERCHLAEAKGDHRTAAEIDKIKKNHESMRKDAGVFLESMLKDVDENDPIYWYKYKRDKNGEVVEDGYLIVSLAGEIKKFIECVEKGEGQDGK